MPSKPNKKTTTRHKKSSKKKSGKKTSRGGSREVVAAGLTDATEPTLRGSLSDSVNEINKLILSGVPPAEEEKLRKLRKAYFKLWEAVIVNIIDNNTALYKEAIASLQEATKAATAAREEIGKVSMAINKAVKAAQAVDEIVNAGIGFIM
jgi:hypothetical protein